MKKGRWLILLAILAFIYFFFIAGPTGLIRLFKLQKREKKVLQEIKRTKVEIEIIRREIKRLRKDTAFIKMIASKYLGMVEKKGEDSSKKDTVQKP